MSVQMQQLQLKLDDDAFKDVVFLSHTVDPEHDTPGGAGLLRKQA